MSWEMMDWEPYQPEKDDGPREEPLNLSQAEVPKSWEDLERLIAGGGRLGAFYQWTKAEMELLVTPGRAFIGDADVERFFGSYMDWDPSDDNAVWVQMMREGLEADREQQIARNFQQMLGMLGEVREEIEQTQLRRFFGVDSGKDNTFDSDSEY